MQKADMDGWHMAPVEDEDLKPRRPSAFSRGASAAATVIVHIVHHSLALAPFLVLATLYIFSWRVQALIGHWPQPSVDDPKYAAPGDGLSDFLYAAVIPLFLWTVAAIVLLPVSSWMLRKRYSIRYIIFLLSLFAVGCLLLRLDPGSRFAWFVD